MMKIALAAMTSFFMLLGVLKGTAGCGPNMPTPAQQGAAVDGSCTVLEAFVASPLEQVLCATAEELVAAEADIRSVRADAGPGKLGRMSGKCKIVPKTTVCATEDELAFAIQMRKAARR